MRVIERETSKYAQIWAHPHYRDHSPGHEWADLFGRIAHPRAGQTVVDLGCGAGEGGMILEEKFSLVPSYMDFVKVEGAPEPFREQCLWLPIEGEWNYGYCCDVLEHIPEQFTMLAVRNILDACSAAFFSVSFGQDGFGAYIRKPLHMTVKPFPWWRDALREIATVIEARDMIGEGIFYVAR